MTPEERKDLSKAISLLDGIAQGRFMVKPKGQSKEEWDIYKIGTKHLNKVIADLVNIQSFGA